MKRKILSVVLAATMSIALFAGCGSSSKSSSGDSKKAAAVDTSKEGKHELSVYAWDKNFNIPALEAAEKAYQKKDPEFKLNIIEQSQSSDVENAITLAGSSNDYSTLPDIVLFQDHYINRYVHDYPDAWVDVNDADINWDDFGQEKISYSTIDGKHYGVPVDNGTVIFAYRTDLLKEAGYTIDDVTGITWDQFDEIGKKVYDKTGKYLLSMDGDGNDLPYMMLQAEGVSQFKDGKPNFVDNKTMVDIINVIVKLVQDNVLYLANDWSDYTDQTIVGDMVAGVMNGNWIIPTIEQVKENSGKWEITTLPTLSGKEGYASNGGSSLYITGNCQNKGSPGFYFYHVTDSFLIQFRLGSYCCDQRSFFNQRNGTMLQFPCGIGLRMNIGNLFQFQRAFQRNGVIDTTSDKENVFCRQITIGKFLNLFLCI